MSLHLVSTILFFGILQSVIVNLLIVLTRKWRQLNNLLLIAISFALSLTLLPTFLGNAGIIENFDYLIFIPLDLSLFLFILLFFYVKFFCFEKYEVVGTELYHLVLPVIFWLYYLFVWIKTISVPVESKGIVAAELFYFEVQSIHQVFLILTAVCYGYLSAGMLNGIDVTRLSKKQIDFRKYLKVLLIFLVLGVILDTTSMFIGKYYGYWNGSPFDKWLGIPFNVLVKIYYSSLVYLIALMGFTFFTDISFKKSQLSKERIKELLPEIVRQMEAHKYYMDPNLTLQAFARKMDTTPGTISAVLNKEMKISYSDFVNSYRVQEVKTRLQTDDLEKYTLLTLAKESGFKSKTTFYRAFQKVEQQSPISFLKKMESK